MRLSAASKASNGLVPMTMPARDYVYDALLHRVVDGDTAWLDVDLGGHVYARWECRLRGYDAPAKRSKPGIESTAALTRLLTGALRITTVKDQDDVYGRYLVRVWRVDTGAEVASVMIADRYGVPWDGTGGHPAQDGAEPNRR